MKKEGVSSINEAPSFFIKIVDVARAVIYTTPIYILLFTNCQVL